MAGQSLKWLASLIGFEIVPAGHAEKAVSALGALLGIAAIFMVNNLLPSDVAAVPIVASMGASAVLLYAVPGSPLTQPWPVLGGHLVSALVGVVCQQFIASSMIAAMVAVPAAIVAMYYLHCIHPPGGATALLPIIGGAPIEELGFWFLLDPILVDSLILLLVAFIINRLTPWRHHRQDNRVAREFHPATLQLEHCDLLHALEHSHCYVDICEEDLMQLYQQAAHHAERRLNGEIA